MSGVVWKLSDESKWLKAILLLKTKKNLGLLSENLINQVGELSSFNSLAWNEGKSTTCLRHLTVHCDHSIAHQNVIETTQCMGSTLFDVKTWLLVRCWINYFLKQVEIKKKLAATTSNVANLVPRNVATRWD